MVKETYMSISTSALLLLTYLTENIMICWILPQIAPRPNWRRPIAKSTVPLHSVEDYLWSSMFPEHLSCILIRVEIQNCSRRCRMRKSENFSRNTQTYHFFPFTAMKFYLTLRSVPFMMPGGRLVFQSLVAWVAWILRYVQTFINKNRQSMSLF